ncbi:virulence RhuM family protein [Parabacteroides gordonii]|uniref:Bro-N domain-containing protein n=1 Tax=Parabacteroides gordonii MS-1 = DSM 23371 TaxID=1203610 RepID=A0A0F5J8R1_9BACT|nr:RhuM family protein [Parabacteroides gordonii]KKB54098.1 hypothetical protein HMPREF1536_03679 [Parabacteroides gordonii MS-1 = DSM 23371]MCA5584918.1 virulence RhuM family protein [Parabacteroides gordonii]
MKNQGEIIFYHPEATLKMEVRIENETVWLTQVQIAELFGVKQPAISKHLKNIYDSGELNEESTYSILEYMGNDGKQKYQTRFYNLDAILSVGYRVNSKNATRFRVWANKILKDYLLKGYAINRRIENIEAKLIEHDQKIDFFVRNALPPVEGIFFDGQLFDAYKFAADLIKSARKSIVLIDNYVDDSVLMLLTKRNVHVTAVIYTAQISKQLALDLQRHNAQYEPVVIKQFRQSHDRFLLIDNKDIYHIGASLKDLGKKWFAFSKLNLDIKDIMQKII